MERVIHNKNNMVFEVPRRCLVPLYRVQKPCYACYGFRFNTNILPIIHKRVVPNIHSDIEKAQEKIKMFR